MAHMIPDQLLPDEFVPASLEDKTFEKLRALPDEYTVFHSFRVSSAAEREIDFLIFHKDKGLLCLESKAGSVSYSCGRWYYRSGDPMKGRGPYQQSQSAMWELLGKLRDFQSKHDSDPLRNDLSRRVLFQYGVCFPSISRNDFNKIDLPQDADPLRTLTADELKPDKIKESIDAVFAHPAGYQVTEQLDENGRKILFNEFLCPAFDIVPSPNVEKADRDGRFLRLLKEQARVLDFLVDQRSAAICGSAGTGKTLIALEKARRDAANGGKVLFLCYNSFLKDDLKARLEFDRKQSASSDNSDKIDVQTIAGYACSVCKTRSPDYSRLNSELETMFDNNSFPFDHVVVDEAQDFGSLDDGKYDGRTYDVLKTIKMCLEGRENGTFYLFYDRMQMVQARNLSSVIDETDCKLTLHVNCRNTANIAKTSVSLMPRNGRRQGVNPCYRLIEGAPPTIHFTEGRTTEEVLEKTIQDIQRDRTLETIAILTCKTEEKSSAAQIIQKKANGRNVCRIGGKDVLFTTCRKFKGLEADAVVLVDVDRDTFLNDEDLLFYVGASRARFRLDIIASIGNDDMAAFVEKKGRSHKRGRERIEFLNAINCTTA